jgi:hypothetical protein
MAERSIGAPRAPTAAETAARFAGRDRVDMSDVHRRTAGTGGAGGTGGTGGAGGTGGKATLLRIAAQ